MTDRTVLMFHGLGGDGNSMIPVGKYCSDLLPATEFLSIESSLDLGGPGSPLLAWFIPPADDGRALESPNPPEFAGLKNSLAVAHQAIDDAVRRRGDAGSVHLLGHSQGGAMAIAAGLTYPQQLGSVCSVAGYLAVQPDSPLTAAKTKFFLHHSPHDDNVGFRWADYTREFIERQGNPCVVVSWQITAEPHGIHAEQLDAICATIAGDQG